LRFYRYGRCTRFCRIRWPGLRGSVARFLLIVIVVSHFRHTVCKQKGRNRCNKQELGVPSAGQAASTLEGHAVRVMYRGAIRTLERGLSVARISTRNRGKAGQGRLRQNSRPGHAELYTSCNFVLVFRSGIFLHCRSQPLRTKISLSLCIAPRRTFK
jgi:hypothetical protein